MQHWKKDILILIGIVVIWFLIGLLVQNKVCANDDKTCIVSPIPTDMIVESPTPSISISCTPTPTLQLTLQPTLGIVQPTETGIPATGIPNTPVPETGTPNAGQSATIALPTQAPDTGRAQ